ncbi:MAG TPA: acetoacetate decarboxylase family protein [Acidimicrobiales bacterium]|nr:acetoacetate decarboxylase family protein [Acidimicrobiales bacterium]
MGRIRYGPRTPEQLENREVKATSVGAWSTSLTATYETDPEAVAAVLPPPLEPTDEPLVRVSVARVDLGEGRPPFGAGTFAVQARHEGQVGNYPLVMPMTTEQSVVGGRETFGEPKKLAEVTLERDGDRVVGRVTRLGTTFIEVAGTVTEELPVPEDLHRVDFYLKFLPAPDGKGFDGEPALVYCHRTESARSLARVDGGVTLRESRFDPVADLPVRRLVSLTLSERRSVQRGEIVARVPGEWIAPYAHQRYDDLSPVGDE